MKVPSPVRPLVPPIHQSSTFVLDDEAYRDIVSNEGLGVTWYSRFGNPTVQAAAEAVGILEGGEGALLTSSGMAAIATTLLSLCKAGERIVAAREVYGDTRDLFVRDLPALGVCVDFVPVADTEAWRSALAAAPVRLAYAETIANPQLRMLDIATVAGLAHDVGALLVVDNTFASPAVVQPLALGADIVVNSVTKFLNGHSDVIAGAVVASEAHLREIHRRVITLGGCLDPHAAFLVHRGLKTFGLRVAKQNASAKILAGAMASFDGVQSVIHPTLSDYPQAALAARQCREGWGGGVFTAVLEGGNDRAARFMRALEVVTEATSLGGVESLVSAPHNSSHFSLSDEELALAGISAGMVRVSVGIEPQEQLLDDLAHALKVSG